MGPLLDCAPHYTLHTRMRQLIRGYELTEQEVRDVLTYCNSQPKEQIDICFDFIIAAPASVDAFRR
jgi:hypothetical protein